MKKALDMQTDVDMETSELHRIVKHQFNRQAQNFSNWSVTRNVEYLRAYADFCRLSPGDRLLDVACGSGEFVIFCAPGIKYAHGVDISEGMIELAEKQSAAQNLNNTRFICHQVENAPFENSAFTVVTCRNAFHHFKPYVQIFAEMVRCCEIGGRIGIQDIVAYPDGRVDRYFEELEHEIDISHHATLTKKRMLDLYDRKEIAIENTFDVEVELNFQDYLGHAQQTEDGLKKIEKLLAFGLKDPEISKYYIVKNDDVFFKRAVFLALGVKRR